MATTSHLGLTLIETAQAQKEVTANTAFTRIDAILNTGAIDKDLATPPGSPAEGDVYIVAASPTGAWAGQAGKIAFYSQTWQFITPLEGATLWVKDEDVLYSYTGSAWVANSSSVRQAVTSVASTTINLNAGNVVELAHDTNITTFTWNNAAAAGRMQELTLIRVKDNNGTTRTIAWPASVDWAGGTPPTLTQTANAVDIFRFITVDGGARWYGFTLGMNMS